MLVPLLVGVLFLVPGVTAVEDKIDSKFLVGKWEPEALPDGVDKMTVEFHKGDKVTRDLEARGMKQKMQGTYKVDGNNLTFKMEIMGNEMEQKRKIVKLTESQLVTKDETMDVERKFKKVK